MGLNQHRKYRPGIKQDIIEKKISPRYIKIGILGDEKVGKTWICNSFLNIDVPEDYLFTIGFDKFDKKISLENGKEIRLVIYDTGGKERFRSSIIKCLQHVGGLVLVFDVTDRKSFDNLEGWLKIIKENFANPITILFGNKVDINKEKWAITEEEIEGFVKKEGLEYFDVSAKNKIGIVKGFNFLANTIYIKLMKKYIDI